MNPNNEREKHEELLRICYGDEKDARTTLVKSEATPNMSSQTTDSQNMSMKHENRNMSSDVGSAFPLKDFIVWFNRIMYPEYVEPSTHECAFWAWQKRGEVDRKLLEHQGRTMQSMSDLIVKFEAEVALLRSWIEKLLPEVFCLYQQAGHGRVDEDQTSTVGKLYAETRRALSKEGES